ncbi:unnamed protein product [Brassica rapa]|uniref:Uncharacterized protein n=2 Tax=Brassica TaxID=3705 RepID=A0A3P5ZD77_BRACM|nr:unnamed protein product [Brassica napus]CAG7886051.1 unnamed protein product [Brassica rapa]VDC73614.1 unnamed protein product [Brassica rapa]
MTRRIFQIWDLVGCSVINVAKMLLSWGLVMEKRGD